MKTRLLLFALFIATGLMVSCSDDDEPKVNPLVGEWTLDDVTVLEAPPSFSLMVGSRTSSYYGEEEYTIEFESDFTYIRKLDNVPTSVGLQNIDDEGTWESNDDELILESDNGFQEFLMYEFKLVELIDGDLVLEGDDQIPAFPDEIYNDPEALDTITTQAGYDYMVENYSQIVTVTSSFEFNRR